MRSKLVILVRHGPNRKAAQPPRSLQTMRRVNRSLHGFIACFLTILSSSSFLSLLRFGCVHTVVLPVAIRIGFNLPRYYAATCTSRRPKRCFRRLKRDGSRISTPRQLSLDL